MAAERYDGPMRMEHDSMGEIPVPANHLWGAQTQRSLTHFDIGWERFPLPFIYDYAHLKKAAALANGELGELTRPQVDVIARACDEIIAGEHDAEFPLAVWQTGSGTQTNMNLNEVIANRANQLAGGALGSNKPIHPNNHVNRSQSSNDSFPTVMHMSVYRQLQYQLLPALQTLRQQLADDARRFHQHIKIGRTHLMDAVPLTLGQEFSAFVAQLDSAAHHLQGRCRGLSELAIGATAVGTGLNAPEEFAERVVYHLQSQLNLPFTLASNSFAALAAHDALTGLHGGLQQLATTLMKIGNDIRLLGSGPRCGLGELQLPANEPGSSIMPGKVNPTQCEAMTMVACQVLGNAQTVMLAASHGQLQLNVFKPVLLYNSLQSLRLLSDVMQSFSRHCAAGLSVNAERLAHYTRQSLMLVTALSPHLGYDQAAQIAHHAHQQGISLKDAALALDVCSAEEYDQWVDIKAMVPGADEELPL